VPITAHETPIMELKKCRNRKLGIKDLLQRFESAAIGLFFFVVLELLGIITLSNCP